MTNKLQEILDTLPLDTPDDIENSSKILVKFLNDPEWVKEHNPDLSPLYTTLANYPALGEQMWGDFRLNDEVSAKDPGDVIACCCSSGSGPRPTR